MARYDRIITSLATARFPGEALVGDFGQISGLEAVASHLCGLADFARKDWRAAQQHFKHATSVRPAWVAPWLGWAAATFQLQEYDILSGEHPHLTGVEMLPYDSGDEKTFLAIAEPEREELVELFQATAKSLGNYYTMAEICRSKQRMIATQAELQKVA